MATVWKTLTRRKVILQPEDSSLARVLSTYDLTFLGIGATLGVGLYVLVGKVARETAGPSVVLSFFIAAVASAFAGLCYAEFGARVPRAGSAYIYAYVGVGEFIAFVIGWNLILEYVIGSASVAHGMSLYIDAMANDTMQKSFIDVAPIKLSFLSPYFDFFAFGVSIVLAVALALGVKESSLFNNCITGLNLLVVVTVIIVGGLQAKFSNWSLAQSEVGPDGGKGGFFPFGIIGTIKGAATCFYGFVGFDCIATTGEEARNPRKAIPIAILTSLGISMFAYCGTSAVITLMVPYFEQDIDSPIPYAFEKVGLTDWKWVVSTGGCLALSASLFGAMFPLPRILYAMASDGLIFKFLGIVNSRFATPIIGTLIAGVLTGILGAIFKQGHLIDMMSIGTLLAYTIVAACVLILRYARDSHYIVAVDGQDNDESESRNKSYKNHNAGNNFVTFFNVNGIQEPTKKTETFVIIEVFVFCILAILLGVCAKFLPEDIYDGEVYAIVLLSLVIIAILIILVSLYRQPRNSDKLSFKVPLVPLIPCLSIIINIYLMMSLDVATWIRFGIWMAIGLPMYICTARCSTDSNALQIGCKTRNMSEGSTYVNFGFLHGQDDHEIVQKGEAQQEMQMKGCADSDSGAYFEENEGETGELEFANNGDESSVKTYGMDTTSVREVLVTFDDMLEKEEEKCGEDLGLNQCPIVYRNRSVSIVSSVSNNSYTLPLEERVEAIIHREDEREPIPEEIEVELEDQIQGSENEDPVSSEVTSPEPTIEEDVEKVEVEEKDEKKNKVKEEENEVVEDEESEESSSNEEIPSAPPPPPLPNLELITPTIDIEPSTLILPAPPPPPPSPMTQFEVFKQEDYTLMRNNLKKTKRPITPPLSPPQTKRPSLNAHSKSETSLYTPPEDNIKLTSENIKTFKEKLEMDLGHRPNNLKFNVFPAPNYYSLDRPLKTSSNKEKQPLSNTEQLTTSFESNDNQDPQLRKISRGVNDESLKNINLADIRGRLEKLYSLGGSMEAPPGLMYKNRKKKQEEEEFGETKV